jgi:hypothetical protein
MRVELAYFNLAEKNPELAEIDARINEHNRRRWEILKIHSRDLKLSAQPTA